MRPTIGRTVHYHDTVKGRGPYPAIVQRVHDDGTLDLNVFIGRLMVYKERVALRTEKHPCCTWSWPERV